MSGASTQQNMIIGGAILAVFALGASFILAFTYDNTKATIAENEKLFLLNTLYQLVPASAIDNDLYTDKIKLSDNTLSYHQQAFTIYRARKNSQAVAAIFHVTTGQG
ncbi:MAG: hypothetical protein OEZ58_23990, partial [Gammaproteobacteria bacterium]|nr:hypothetical protein [Gammaproteobacteria bacterium]